MKPQISGPNICPPPKISRTWSLTCTLSGAGGATGHSGDRGVLHTLVHRVCVLWQLCELPAQWGSGNGWPSPRSLLLSFKAEIPPTVVSQNTSCWGRSEAPETPHVNWKSPFSLAPWEVIQGLTLPSYEFPASWTLGHLVPW